MEQHANLDFLALYRVRPADSSPPLISGGPLRLTKALTEIFLPPFTGTDKKLGKKQPFHFKFSNDRRNQTREALISLFEKPRSRNSIAESLAKKLQALLDDRIKELLLTVGIGTVDSVHRCVLWVYPTDTPIQFRSSKTGPSVSEIRDAFSRSSRLRKAVYFDSPARITRNDLLRGEVVDHSTGNKGKTWTNYWVEGFLDGGIELQSSRATILLIKGLKKAQSKASSSPEYSSVMAAYHSLISQPNQTTTLARFSSLLTGAPKTAYLESIPDTLERDASFVVAADEVARKIKALVFHLENGVDVVFPPDGSIDPTDFISTQNQQEIMEIRSQIRGRDYDA